MADEKLIQVNLQLPASELAGLTALAEQLQKLLSVGSQSATGETEKNTAFDADRFHAMENAENVSAETGVAFSGQLPTAEMVVSDIPGAQEAETPDFPEIKDTASVEIPPWAEVAAAALSRTVDGVIPAPPSAEATVSDIGALPSSQHGNSTVERLITSAPAPLTAEAVSMAFRRDDRRYDNGFPLY